MEDRFRIGDAFRFGWEVMADNLGFFVLVLLIFWVADLIPSLLQRLFYDVYPLVTIFAIMAFVITVFVAMAYTRIGLKFCDGAPPEYSDIYAAYPAFWRFLAGSLLYALLVIAGLILLVVPGVYWAIKYFFVTYLILDRDMGPIEAFGRSADITYGEKWYLLVFGLAIIGINILGVILCVVGLFVSIPISIVATAYVYRRLLVTAGGQVSGQAATGARPPQAEPGSPGSAVGEPAKEPAAPSGTQAPRGDRSRRGAPTGDEQPPVPPPPQAR